MTNTLYSYSTWCMRTPVGGLYMFLLGRGVVPAIHIAKTCVGRMAPVVFISCHYVHFIDGETEACQHEVIVGEPNSEPRTMSSYIQSCTCNGVQRETAGQGRQRPSGLDLGSLKSARAPNVLLIRNKDPVGRTFTLWC